MVERETQVMNNYEMDQHKERQRLTQMDRTHGKRDACNGRQMRESTTSRSGMECTQRGSHAGDGESEITEFEIHKDGKSKHLKRKHRMATICAEMITEMRVADEIVFRIN